jgi:death-on-curing protein
VKEPQWVLRETVLAVHDRLLAEFGGARGLRDEGLLEMALARPYPRMAYGKPSVFDLAATYASGLVQNQPFVDGNKRIGFAIAVVFLELNSYHFAASEVESTLKTLAMAAGEVDEEGYAAWLKANARRV